MHGLEQWTDVLLGQKRSMFDPLTSGPSIFAGLTKVSWTSTMAQDRPLKTVHVGLKFTFAKIFDILRNFDCNNFLVVFKNEISGSAFVCGVGRASTLN